MTSRSIAVSAAALLAAACQTDRRSASAQTDPAGSTTASADLAPGPDGYAGDRVVVGRVTRISPDAISIATGDRSVQTLHVDEHTVFVLGGDTGSLGELREGDEVRASFRTDASGRLTAVRISDSADRDYQSGVAGDANQGNVGAGGTAPQSYGGGGPRDQPDSPPEGQRRR